MEHTIEAGDKVRVDIENDAPIGPDTQMATFVAETVTDTEIVGTDPAWGDTCTLEGINTDQPRYTDAGKSGDVVEFKAV